MHQTQLAVAASKRQLAEKKICRQLVLADLARGWSTRKEFVRLLIHVNIVHGFLER